MVVVVVVGGAGAGGCGGATGGAGAGSLFTSIFGQRLMRTACFCFTILHLLLIT